MAGETDLPKYWNEETGEIIETYPENTAALMPQEEVEPLPTIAEQTEIIKTAEVNEDNMSMLNSLVEMNRVAETLNALRSTESQEMRRNVLTAWCESFVNSRMINNVAAEKLKAQILDRLSENLNILDIETISRIYNDLHEVTAVDDSIEATAVDLQVVTDIAQGLSDIRIGFGVDIAFVCGGGEVVVIECSFVGAHIAFIEQVKADNLGADGVAFLLLFGGKDDLWPSTGHEHKNAHDS